MNSIDIYQQGSRLLKWWFVSLFLVAPVVAFSYFSLKDQEGLDIIILCVIFSIFYSLPCLSLLYIISAIFPMRKLSPLMVNLIYTIIAVSGVLITLYSVGGSMSTDLMDIYSISVIIGMLINPIRRNIDTNDVFRADADPD